MTMQSTTVGDVVRALRAAMGEKVQKHMRTLYRSHGVLFTTIDRNGQVVLHLVAKGLRHLPVTSEETLGQALDIVSAECDCFADSGSIAQATGLLRPLWRTFRIVHFGQRFLGYRTTDGAESSSMETEEAAQMELRLKKIQEEIAGLEGKPWCTLADTDGPALDPSETDDWSRITSGRRLAGPPSLKEEEPNPACKDCEPHASSKIPEAFKEQPMMDLEEEQPIGAEAPTTPQAETGAEAPADTGAEAPAVAEAPADTGAEAPAVAEAPADTGAEAPEVAEAPADTGAEAPVAESPAPEGAPAPKGRKARKGAKKPKGAKAPDSKTALNAAAYQNFVATWRQSELIQGLPPACMWPACRGLWAAQKGDHKKALLLMNTVLAQARQPEIASFGRQTMLATLVDLSETLRVQNTALPGCGRCRYNEGGVPTLLRGEAPLGG